MTCGLPLTVETACHDRVAPSALLAGEARAPYDDNFFYHFDCFVALRLGEDGTAMGTALIVIPQRCVSNK